MRRKKAERLLEKMRHSPQNWRYGRVRRILEAFGFELASGGRGSHRTFRHPSLEDHLTIVDNGSGTMRAVYVRMVVAAIDSVKEGT